MEHLVTLLQTRPQSVSSFLSSSDAQAIGTQELCLACCYLVRTQGLNEVQKVRSTVAQAELKRIDTALLQLCASTDNGELLDFLEDNKCELTEYTFSLCVLAASSGSQQVLLRLLKHICPTPLQKKHLLDFAVCAGFSLPEYESLADEHTFKRACERGDKGLVSRFLSLASSDVFEVAISTGMIQSEEDLQTFFTSNRVDEAMITAAKRGHFETISILLRCLPWYQKPSQATVYRIACSAIDCHEKDFFEFVLHFLHDKGLYVNLLRHTALLDDDEVLEQILWVCEPLDVVSYRKVLTTARKASSTKCQKVLEEGPRSKDFFVLRPFLYVPTHKT